MLCYMLKLCQEGRSYDVFLQQKNKQKATQRHREQTDAHSLDTHSKSCPAQKTPVRLIHSQKLPPEGTMAWRTWKHTEAPASRGQCGVRNVKRPRCQVGRAGSRPLAAIYWERNASSRKPRRSSGMASIGSLRPHARSSPELQGRSIKTSCVHLGPAPQNKCGSWAEPGPQTSSLWACARLLSCFSEAFC